MLRIDPLGIYGTNGQYGIPATNPFVGVSGDDEIWSYGLRNPWRCCFDSMTGDLYIADVGQGDREEIDVQPDGDAGGTNYGWRDREGTNGPTLAGAIDPIYDYAHGSGDDEGFSVTGGCVYRGPITVLQGQYFFADYVTDRIWSLKWDGSNPSTHDGTNYFEFRDWTERITTSSGSIRNISSFGEDDSGNLYIVDLAGEVFVIDGATIPTLVQGQKLLDGIMAAGDLSDLGESDDEYILYENFPSPNPAKQRVDVFFTTEAATSTPANLSFRLEAKMIGGPAGDVIQSVYLYNYQSQQFDLLETGAAPTVDERNEYTFGKNPQMYVNPKTRELLARVIWYSETFSGDPFFWSIELDELVWPTAE